MAEKLKTVMGSEVRFNRQALRAVRAYARTKPWSGSIEKRWRAMAALSRTLSGIYGMGNGPAIYPCLKWQDCYIHPLRCILICPYNLSVVTFLHEFKHAMDSFRGQPSHEESTRRWSLWLFKKCFPKEFSRCCFDGQRLLRRWSSHERGRLEVRYRD